MKNCGTCLKYDCITEDFGVCSDTGETVGVNNDCKDWIGDNSKHEEGGEE